MEKNKGSSSVGIYDRYDLDTWMKPIWEGQVVHNETVMFVDDDNGASLIYKPDKVLSVRSYDLTVEYTEGVDYKIEKNKIVRLETSRIPSCPLSTYYSAGDRELLYTLRDGVVTPTMYGEGEKMTRWEVAVTYTHSGTWDGLKARSYADRYADFINKLKNGEDVTVFFYGDSITAGASASSGSAPYTPQWTMMFCEYAAKQYGYTVKYVTHKRDDAVFGTRGTITYINTAVGGWTTEQGLNNLGTHVMPYIEEHGCDLFVLAISLNNTQSTASYICGLLKEITDKVVDKAPDTDVVIVSPMIPNPEAVRKADEWFVNGTQPTFEAGMLPLADEIHNGGTNCAMCPMTSISKYIHSKKRFRDTTGNNVNHPSDFLVRVYAQALFETVFGYENYSDSTT